MEKFLTPEEFNIDDLFKGKYLIPIYQRPYSWGECEVKQLLKDIDYTHNIFINSTQSVNDDSLLFIGTLFIKADRNVKNTYTEYDIVDGQQRITTLTLILMVILNKLYRLNSDDEIVKDIENYLWKKVDRKRDKSLRVLTLGNIDKDIMNSLFDKLFTKEDIIDFASKKLNENIEVIEQNLLSNIILINNHFSNFEENKLYDYIDYVKYNIRIIAIKVHTKLPKLFNIFESINSKGKPLEDIDLIKSYIFQNISQNNYEEYLSKWGKLIISTNDNIMDYFTIYVRANIAYYRNSIKLMNFKSLVENNFSSYFDTNNIEDTLLHLIDDLIENVKYYNMLTNPDLLEQVNVSRKSIVYFMMNNSIEYVHTKALFFKLLVLKANNNLSDFTFDSIIEKAFKFILTFQSICNRESKNTLNVFIDAQNELYKVTTTYNDKKDLSSMDFKNIEYIFYKKIKDEIITTETLRSRIKNTITYIRNKKVTKNILSYLVYLDNDNNIDYLKLYWLLKFGKDIHIDHILPLNPAKNDDNFSYYLKDNIVILKDNQDFVINSDTNQITKEEFYETFLHVLGNLRLDWSNDNIRKSNKLISLEIFNEKFNTNTQISKRTSLLIKKLLESNLLLSSNTIPDISVEPRNSSNRLIENNNNSIEYKDFEPIYAEILGEQYILEQHKYAHLLIKVMEIFYDIEKDNFKEIACQKYCPTTSNRAYISNNPNDLRKVFKLDEDVYIETNLSSEYIIDFIFKFSKKLGFSNGDIKIMLSKKG